MEKNILTKGGAIKVSGLEINESRITLLSLRRKGSKFQVERFGQKELTPGTIVRGVLVNPQAFKQSLKELKKQAKPASPLLIIAMPENLTYLSSKNFPNLDRDELEEAIELNFHEFIPGDPNEIYWGWQEEKISNNSKQVIFASARKSDLKNYLAVFNEVGLIPMVIEPSSMAARRAFNNKSEFILFVVENNATMAAIYHDGKIRYSTSFSVGIADKKTLFDRMKQVLNFIRAEKNNDEIEVILSGNAANDELAQELANITQKEVKLAGPELNFSSDKIKSPIVLGAALRGLIEQKNDDNLSLLPVNAQESYEEKRALRFFGGIINLVAITGAIFLILFYGFLAFLFYLENQQSQKLANLPNVQTTNNQLDQKEVTEMSTLVKKIAGLISGEESWAPILSQINVASKKGINLTNITWVKSGEPVNLVGNAQSQDALADFKNILSKSSYFDRVTLSSTNLNENQTLNFTISLTLKSKALETNE